MTFVPVSSNRPVPYGLRTLYLRVVEGFVARLRNLAPETLALLSLGMVLGIGFADYATNPNISFSVIYLVPIVTAAWFLNGWFAFVLSLVSVVLWIAGDVHAHLYDSPVVPLWNGILRLAFYMVVVSLLTELRKSQTDLETRAEEKARALTSEIAARENLESELLRISEREQRRFGQDIHDSLCQHLTATALAGQALTERLASRGDSEAVRAARLVELVEQGIGLSRDLAKGLNPIDMRAHGLMEGLEQFADATSQLFPVACRFECDYPVLFNDSDTAVHVYRIAQEAVSNAVKHGKAKSITIRLEVSDRGKILKVIDDGVGFRLPHGNAAGMGLRIMSYRARIVGGHLDIAPEPGAGTRITCFVPDVRLTHG
ncbi:MAG TPA: sensor histidine kinase [Rhizomicrobium sp.]|nr:sensor histidine kinase [Rhizomicrobium sp.]